MSSAWRLNRSSRSAARAIACQRFSRGSVAIRSRSQCRCSRSPMRKCKAATSSIERSVALATPTMSSAAKRSPRLATRPAELRRDALLDGGLHARVELLALAGYQHAKQCRGDRGRPVWPGARGCPAGAVCCAGASASRARRGGGPSGRPHRTSQPMSPRGRTGGARVSPAVQWQHRPALGKIHLQPGHGTRCPRGCRDTVGTCVECHARHGVCRYRS